MRTRDLCNETLKLSPTTGLNTVVGILPGQHEDWRMSEVLWEALTDTVWVAGTKDAPAYTKSQIENLVGFRGNTPQELEMQIYADHLPAQTSWMVELLQAHPEVEQLILSTADYHLPRAILTFVQSWEKLAGNRVIRLANLPTSAPDATPSHKEQCFEDELKRIELYQKSGDVATLQVFKTFVKKMNR